jgi:hypothetical protein
MKNLKELYEANVDVRESQIPLEWRESFSQFMFGSTCSAELDEDGKIKEFIYYACDFRGWYFQNKEAIERDIKIDEICKEENSYTHKK